MKGTQEEFVTRIRGLIYGNWQTCVTYTFAELGLADMLQDGAKSLEFLSNQTAIDPKNMLRFLRCCAQLQFVRIAADTKEVTLTEFGSYLQSNHPYTQRDAARLNGVNYRYGPWGRMVEILKSGSGDGFSDTHKNGSLEYLKDKPALLESFQKAMTNISVTENENIVKNYDFSNYSHIIDIGGGHGTFIRAILEANPMMSGTIFDLRETLASVKLPVDALSERIALQEGDFFQDIPINGDVYTLKNILHNWPEEKVRHIMRNLHLALSKAPDAAQKRVLVIEHMMSDAMASESIVPWMDMNFFILVGGQDRTLGEYSELFASCGFVMTNVILTQSGRSIMELGI